ncbi:MAG: 3-phosphoserine/phosphohydroxythreonine transaminase [Phycisphaerales bacterium]|nr:3-phosphoserine/phosphohydroxythreonine transaminase [Phycisphaerales bacterium]
MSVRAFNFSAGPAILPEAVLHKAQQDLLDIDESGVGILEHSHRGPEFDRILAETEEVGRAVGNVPDNYRMLFLQGGASTQFFMLPANFLGADDTADHLVTGKWAKMASEEVDRWGRLHVAASTEADKFSHLPDEIQWSDAPAYCHYTSNNTIYGIQHETIPDAPGPLVCDASSDIYSRPWDISKHAMIYASAQKNLGPSGTTVVIIRDDMLDRTVRDLPPMLRYATHAEKESRYNTPPVFGIYLIGEVFKWIRDQGGLEAIEARNIHKARLIYDVIDGSRFYTGMARTKDRSLMNVVFRTPSPELDEAFVAEAAEHRLVGLKGYRSVGGMRCSIYNAFPVEGCERLAEFMKEFERVNG